jgi:NAD(P)-dependent dehydrogenase (short-subunit alcohol dehydrogenase family)
MATGGISLAPADWPVHRFGLSQKQWDALRSLSVWVTGAATGYGRALATVLALAGAEVILSSRREALLIETAARVRDQIAPGARLHVLPVDLSRLKSLPTACVRALELCPNLSGLVNSAAVPQASSAAHPLLGDPIEDIDRMLRVNALAPWILSRELINACRGDRAIRIVNMSSRAGWADTPGFGPYNLSKAALNSLTRSLAAEARDAWPNADIQINALVPAQARTEMNQGSRDSPLLAVPMLLRLLTAGPGGGTGRFLLRDGSSLPFGDQAT